MTRGQVVIGKGVPANHIFIFLALGFLFLLSGMFGQTPANSPIPPDSEIRGILRDRIDKYKQASES